MSSVYRLVFDPTDANTIAASSSVGAYVRAGVDGELIDSTSNALHVLFTNTSLVVTATDLDIRDLSNATDSVTAHQGGTWTIDSITNDVSIDDGGNSITVDASDLDIRDLSSVTDSVSAVQSGTWNIGTLTSITNDVNIADGGNSITVDAIDLDIRDLSSATDSVAAVQSGTWNIGTLTSITNDVNIADGGNSITVDASDLDIRDLTAASDSVQAWAFDGAGTALTSTLEGAKQALDVNVVNDIDVDDGLANSSAVASKSTSNTSAADLIASPLASRKYLYVYNNDNKVAYIGGTGVTTAAGFPVYPGSLLEMRAGAAVDIEVISAQAISDIRCLELA